MRYRASWHILCKSCNELFTNSMETPCVPIGYVSWEVRLAGVTVQEDDSFENTWFFFKNCGLDLDETFRQGAWINP